MTETLAIWVGAPLVASAVFVWREIRLAKRMEVRQMAKDKRKRRRIDCPLWRVVIRYDEHYPLGVVTSRNTDRWVEPDPGTTELAVAATALKMACADGLNNPRVAAIRKMR